MKAQAIATWASGSISEREAIYTNPELVELAVRLGAQYQPKSMEDAMRFGAYFRQFINSWEVLFLQHKLGVVDDDFLQSKTDGYMEIMSFPGVKSWWDSVGKSAYQNDFVAYVDLQYSDQGQRLTNFKKEAQASVSK